MRNMMIVSLGIFLAAWWLLEARFGNHGLWLAMLVFMAARGIWLGACYLRIEPRAGFVAAPAPGGPT